MWRSGIYLLACTTSLAMVLTMMIQAGGMLYPEKFNVILSAAEDAEPPQELEFPVRIPDSQLVLETLVSYEGPFQEDGSDDPVFDILAIVLRNDGPETVQQAEITLENLERDCHFQVENLMPGMTVMVPEQDRCSFRDTGFFDCSAEVTVRENAENLLEHLMLIPEGMGQLKVTNRSDRTLGPLQFFHKNYLPDGMFVGGISYVTDIDALAPGQTVQIAPEHYADGFSKIFLAEEIIQ